MSSGRFKKGNLPHNKGISKYGNGITEKERIKRRNKVMYERKKESILNNQKAYYEKNKHRLKKKTPEEVREYRRSVKLEVFMHYCDGEPKCECCGEDVYDFLSIDHMNNDGKIHRKNIKSSYSFYLWIRRNKYPSNLQILCMNCNWGRSKQPDHICPHKKNHA